MADLIVEYVKQILSWVEENPVTTVVLLGALVLAVYLIKRKFGP